MTPSRWDRLKNNQRVLAAVFLLPTLFVLVSVVLYPFLSAVWISFQAKQAGTPGRFIGFRNYAELLGNPVFLQIAGNTVFYTGVAVAIKFTLGLAAALVLAPVRPLYSAFPETWEKFVEASLKINKPPFYAYGMALGTSPGNDSTEDIMATVWAHGGNIIDKQNRVVFNSPGAVKGFQLIKDMYLKHQIIPKGTLSWDNSGNNKAYQSKQVAFVYNPPSVYSYLLQEDKETAAKTGLFPAPGGPGGRVKRVYVDYYGVFKASPYPDIAKGLIRHFVEPKNYNEFITGTAGRYLPTYPKLLEDPFWTSNKAFAGLIDIGKTGETIAREGVITAALGEVVAQSLLAKSVQTVLVNNVEPAEAVAKAHAEIVAIYKRFNEPV